MIQYKRCKKIYILLVFSWRQTTKLSILLRFYFHDVLKQLKTNFHTNFRFKRILSFLIAYARISKLLRDVAFKWRPRELSCRLKKWLISGNFFYLKSSCNGKSITLMFMSSLRKKFTLLHQNSVTDVFIGAHPGGHQHDVSIQISINLGQ